MAKGYWICFYRSISDPNKLAEYAKLALPVIQAAGGKTLARGLPAKAYEVAPNQRTVVIEFESVEKAIATYESAAYQAARKIIDGSVERDVRIIEGVA